MWVRKTCDAKSHELNQFIIINISISTELTEGDSACTEWNMDPAARLLDQLRLQEVTAIRHLQGDMY